jgi:hypothetical protein
MLIGLVGNGVLLEKEPTMVENGDLKNPTMAKKKQKEKKC